MDYHSTLKSAEFAENEGFKHHRVTPLHPRANGEAEKFMPLNKTDQIAHMKKKQIRKEYRSARHANA
jgi:hypothetical protein